MPNYDATNTNESKSATRIYKDLDLDFGRNVVTNDVNKLTDAEAVKRSVRNLINTNHYDRPFNPAMGSNVRDLLFEPYTELTAVSLTYKIREMIDFYEPRVEIIGLTINPQEDKNAFFMRLEFVIVGTQEPVVVETFLERLR
tara:strand:+ start:245 stop:670 length:426 start_codon:yes stop_codon:yes gene_type:complete